MKRMHTAIATLLLAVAANPAEAAKADRALLPVDAIPYTYYFTLAAVPEDQRESIQKQLNFVVASLNPKTDLGQQLPVKVADDLLRIDTRYLGWEHTLPKVLIEHYPYSEVTKHGVAPLVIRADWFVANIMDPIETGNSQYLLLYGKELKTVGEFLDFWGIQKDPEFIFGTIEGKSGVSVARVRLIENRPGAKRNYGWITHDSAEVAGEKDPLENLPDRAKFDAQELITGVPKWYGGKSGILQAYFLADGKGNRQDRAPADVVVDHSGIRGVEIKNTLSCVACHKTGILPPTEDAFRSYVASGARVFADKDSQQRIDRYLGSDVAKEVARDAADYSDGIALVNGLTAEENTKQFIAAVHAYDADVTLEQAARELYVETETFRLALGDYSRTTGLTGRLAFLASGGSISRDQWVANYHKAQIILAAWEAGK